MISLHSQTLGMQLWLLGHTKIILLIICIGQCVMDHLRERAESKGIKQKNQESYYIHSRIYRQFEESICPKCNTEDNSTPLIILEAICKVNNYKQWHWHTLIKFKVYSDGIKLLPQHPISVTDSKTASLLLAGQKGYHLPKYHHLSSIPLFHDFPETDIEN